MAILAYAIIAVLLILVVALLARQTPREEPAEALAEKEFVQGLWDGRCLNLSERIFDSADYHWLRDELGFPQLADSLVRSRQRVAIRWLKALRTSFDELVRTPEPLLADSRSNAAPGSWNLLWLTLRFHFLLGYALLVVRLFGPYHRLIPSWSWLRFIPEFNSRGSHLGPVDIANFR